ncbi:MAG: septum formation initiator family protein [Nitrospirae bacterium]|nr:septum formation initiator family protein [Nitrospirota bacterium]
MRNARRQQVSQSKKIKQIVSVTIGILCFIYLTLSIIFGENGLLKYMRLKSDMSRLKAEISEIKNQNTVIKKQIETFKKDPNVVEDLARGQGLTKKGELIFKYDDEQ